MLISLIVLRVRVLWLERLTPCRAMLIFVFKMLFIHVLDISIFVAYTGKDNCHRRKITIATLDVYCPNCILHLSQSHALWDF